MDTEGDSDMTLKYLKPKSYAIGAYSKTIKSCGRFQVCTVYDRDGGVVPDDFPSDNVRFIVANSGLKSGETFLINPSIKVFDINGTLLSDIIPPSMTTDKKISINYQQPYPVLQTSVGNMPGFLAFKNRYPTFGLVTTSTTTQIDFTAQVLADLNAVNTYVNETYPWVSDGNLDLWEFASVLGHGDCEDLTLEKAKRLLEMGYPASAIHIETGTLKGLAVWDSNHNLVSGGHAWLCVRTTTRNYYLDNRHADLRSDNQMRGEYENRAQQTGMYWNFVK